MVNLGIVLGVAACVVLAFAQRPDDDDSSFVITSMNRGSGSDRSGNVRRSSGNAGRSRPSSSFDSGDSSNPNSDSFGTSGDRFVPSGSSSRLTGSGSRGRGSSSGGRDQDVFPDYVRIEVEIQRLDNPSGILVNGKKCDFTKSCDPRLNAYLDTSKPLSPWPGSVPANKWPIIFTASNTNSPTIGKSINTDICGGSVNKVNARVKAVDVDSLSSNDDMNNFECVFDVNPRDISLDASSARWGPSTECRSSAQQGKIRLFARQRAYQIPSSSCRASASG